MKLAVKITKIMTAGVFIEGCHDATQPYASPCGCLCEPTRPSRWWCGLLSFKSWRDALENAHDWVQKHVTSSLSLLRFKILKNLSRSGTHAHMKILGSCGLQKFSKNAPRYYIFTSFSSSAALMP